MVNFSANLGVPTGWMGATFCFQISPFFLLQFTVFTSVVLALLCRTTINLGFFLGELRVAQSQRIRESIHRFLKGFGRSGKIRDAKAHMAAKVQ